MNVPIGLVRLYQICFLSGFSISAAVYCGLHYLFPVRPIKDFVANAPAAEILMKRCRDAHDSSGSGSVDEVISVDGIKSG